MQTVTRETFRKQVLDSEVPVIVEAMGPQCGKCKMLAPVLEKTAAKYEGKVKCVQVDVMQWLDLARDNGITSLPALLMYKGGKRVGKRLDPIPSPTVLKGLFDELAV